MTNWETSVNFQIKKERLTRLSNGWHIKIKVSCTPIITWKKIKRAKAIINNPIVCKTATEQPSKDFSRQAFHDGYKSSLQADTGLTQFCP